MREADELRATLRRIDGRGYRSYRDLLGATRLDPRTTLFVDHAQADPFAAPSRLRLRVEGTTPDGYAEGPRRQIAEDWLARRVARAVGRAPRGGGSGKSGQLEADQPGQEVLERSGVRIIGDAVELRLMAGLPAQGRSVLGREAERLLLERIPEVARRALALSPEALGALEGFVETVENQRHLRAQLAPRGLVAFVADGSRLPRASGISELPLDGATPFALPEGDPLALELELLHPPGAKVRGLGLPEGLSLVVGGGYHGKSTFLEAIQRSVYDHVPGDGRERCVTRAQAMKVRAEDGRSVQAVDISGFIGRLPSGRDTRRFSSEDASGSTSQAAGLVEAIEAGADVVLMDEDTSATNFMIRDARMQALVHPEDEPIVPFVDRVRDLYAELGVSTVLVMGGSGDYFQHADAVVQMKDFTPVDVTERARALAREDPRPAPAALRAPAPRVPLARSLDASRGRHEVRVDAPRDDELRFGETTVDLRALEQRVDRPQLRAIGLALHHARRFMDGRSLPEVLDGLEAWLDEVGIDHLASSTGAHPGWLARPRRQELAAALGRHRAFRASAGGEAG